MLIEGRPEGLTYQGRRPDAQAAYRASQLYERARSGNWLDRAWSVLTKRSRRLLDLDVFHRTCTVLTDHQAGVQQVPIRQIRGSVNRGRSLDFDVEFRPLKIHNKERWLGLAMAYQRGIKIPPVNLVQIGDIYFVQDGHHRISVTRALGQTEIKAEVTVWQVAGPLPWQVPPEVHPNLGKGKVKITQDVIFNQGGLL